MLNKAIKKANEKQRLLSIPACTSIFGKVSIIHRPLYHSKTNETLFIDVYAVKFHKKKLSKKRHEKNITEAVGVAVNLRLI